MKHLLCVALVVLVLQKLFLASIALYIEDPIEYPLCTKSEKIDADSVLGKFYKKYTDSGSVFKDDFCHDLGFDTPLLKT